MVCQNLAPHETAFIVVPKCEYLNFATYSRNRNLFGETTVNTAVAAIQMCRESGSTHFRSMPSSWYYTFTHHMWQKVVEVVSFGSQIHVTHKQHRQVKLLLVELKVLHSEYLLSNCRQRHDCCCTGLPNSVTCLASKKSHGLRSGEWRGHYCLLSYLRHGTESFLRS